MANIGTYKLKEIPGELTIKIVIAKGISKYD